MKVSLVTRLAMLIAIIVVLAFASIALVLHRSTSDAYVTSQNETLFLPGAGQVERVLAPLIQDAWSSGGWPKVDRTLQQQIQQTPEFERYKIFVVDDRPNVVVSSEAKLKTMLVEQTGAHEFRLSNKGKNGNSFEIIVDGGVIIRGDSGPIAHLFAMPIEIEREAGEDFATEIWQSVSLWFGSILLFAVAANVILLRRALRPLDRLAAAAKKIQQGEIPEPITLDGDREFKSLYDAFNSATESLIKTQQLRKQMISDVAHELRTPLTNIKSMFEAMNSGLIENDCEASGAISAEIKLLERLVEDFQQLALSDAGQLKVNIEKLPLAETIIASLKPIADSKTASLDVNVPVELNVRVDGDRLKQVLHNLMDNSLRSRPNGLHILINAEIQADYVVMQFGDNGPGIASSDRPYVFDRLYRAEKSRNRSTGGAGLGLSISKSLIEAMGGTIELLEIRETERKPGATFEIKLPVG